MVANRPDEVHSTTRAKGRVERSFGTAQDRLVKGLRVAGAKTIEEANRYLEQEFVPWWNQYLRVVPASAADAHRRLGPEHKLEAALSVAERGTWAAITHSDSTAGCTK